MILFTHFILYLICAYLVINVLYVFIFSMAGVLGKKKVYPVSAEKNRFIILIPAYKGDEVILSTAKLCFNQNYPRELYDVLVISDRLREATVLELRKSGLQVLEVQFEVSTKAKALNAALRSLPVGIYDYAVILDIDNIMHPDFLYRINNSLFDRKLVVQGHRTAKNLDTDFAILDAASEEINNTIFRKGHEVLGLSCALIGSGKAMQYEKLRQLMAEIEAVGGFDKEMEVRLLSARERIYYVEDAVIYDEKVRLPEVFENQRKRWMSAQLFYLRKYAFDAVKSLLLRANVDYFDKMVQFILLPRVLLMLVTLLFALLTLIFPGFFPAEGLWRMLPCLVLVSLVAATPSRLRNFKSFLALKAIPKAALILFFNFFRLKGANKKFIHTPHSSG
jgi:cellulose synthase/poly-beta-1,6-N-acetylglucosamine synthase-like glycosyltransferase